MSSTLSRAVAAASASTSTSASSLSSTDPSSSSINTLSIKPISEQVVVILGGTSGIGRACAFEFYKRGAKVVVASRSRFGVEKTCTDLEESNASHVQLFHDAEHSQLIYKSDRVLGVQCDAADSLHIQTVAHMTRNLFDRIDTWVHVAAVAVVARIEDSNELDLQHMMNVNFFGAVRAAKTLIPIFKHQKGGGSLIFISSVEAKRTIINNGGYAATKHALNALIETLSQEFLADNVPINLHAVMPSTIDTPLFDKCRQNFKNGKKHVGVPLVYSPQLVADTVLYAASSTLAPRDLVVGTSGYLVLQLQKVFGRIMDYMLGWYGDKLEQTEQVISARDNLYEPIDEPQYYATRGTWATWTHDFSLYNFFAEGKWWNLIYK